MFSRKKLLKERDSLQEKISFYEAFLRNPTEETAKALVKVYDADQEFHALVQGGSPYRSSPDLVALVSQAVGEKQKSLVPVSSVHESNLEEVVKSEEVSISGKRSYVKEALKLVGEYFLKGIRYVGVLFLPGRLKEKLYEEFKTDGDLQIETKLGSVLIDALTAGSATYFISENNAYLYLALGVGAGLVAGIVSLFARRMIDEDIKSADGPLITTVPYWGLYISYCALKGVAYDFPKFLGRTVREASMAFDTEVQKRIHKKPAGFLEQQSGTKLGGEDS